MLGLLYDFYGGMLEAKIPFWVVSKHVLFRFYLLGQNLNLVKANLFIFIYHHQFGPKEFNEYI